MALIKRIKPAFWDDPKPTAETHIRLFDYAKVWKYAVFGISAIALLPLIITFVMIVPNDNVDQVLSLPGKRLIGYFIGGMFFIILVVIGVVTKLVNDIYKSDHARIAVLHNIQYTNKMASIGRLSAGVAHEINNPLAIINEKAGLLKDILSMEGEFQREKFLLTVESILSSVARCSAVTHRLLGFARHLDIQFETILLDQVIKDILLFLRKESEYRSITVDLTVPENLPPIKSDRGQLEQVFLNIINNAFAAVDDNGRIDIELFSREPALVGVKISDDGHGISEENLKHIYDPFFSTKEEKGSGLGLSITYGIVQKLGGTLDVKSTQGEGTTFSVTLPIEGEE